MDLKNLEHIISCSICMEIYNEGDRCPRILYCGHSFCHSCLEMLLMKSHCCPTCSTNILFEKTELIPINFSLKSLISTYTFDKLLPNCDSFIKNEKICDSPKPNFNTVLEPKLRKFRSEGYCAEHDSFNELRCIDCESWVCAMCVILYHKQGKCETVLIDEYYRQQIDAISAKVQKELQSRSKVNDGIEKSLKTLNDERSCLIEEIKMKEKELKNKENRIDELESRKIDEHIFCEQLKHLHKLVESSVNDGDFSKAKSDIMSLLEQSKNQVTLSKSKQLHLPLTIESLERICKSESVYAFEDQGTSLYGRVIVNLGRIWIESFEPGKPNGTHIPYKELLVRFNRFYELPKRAFLRLSPISEDGDDIEIVIETDGVSPRAKNFLFLCSALRRHKYKGTTLKLDSLFLQLLPGPPNVVKGIQNNGLIRVKEGVVVGTVDQNSWFAIALKDFPDREHHNHKIGFIVSGLPALQALNGNVLVKECGLVL